MTIKNGSAAALLMWGILATAQTQVQPECRIDIVGQGKPSIGLVYESGNAKMVGTKADWQKNDMDKRLIVTAPVTKEWQTYEFTFTPKNSGAIDIILLSNFSGHPSYLVWFDNLKVSGATLINGSLEDLNTQGQPQGWSQNNSPLVMTDGNAQEGKVYAKVSHARRLIQRVNVEQGKPITVTFSARVGDQLEWDKNK